MSWLESITARSAAAYLKVSQRLHTLVHDKTHTFAEWLNPVQNEMPGLTTTILVCLDVHLFASKVAQEHIEYLVYMSDSAKPASIYASNTAYANPLYKCMIYLKSFCPSLVDSGSTNWAKFLFICRLYCYINNLNIIIRFTVTYWSQVKTLK